MSAHIKLRDYQREAVDAIHDAWSSGMRRPAAVFSTGSGKTVILSALVDEVLKQHNHRVAILVHRDELADQALDKLRQYAPHIDSGKVKAEADEVDKPVVVASVQTLSRPARMRRFLDAGGAQRVIADECHHYASPTFRGVLEQLGCFDSSSGTRAVGFTATLARGDNVGLGDIWEDVVATRSLPWMIERGYLVRPEGISVRIPDLDLRSVRRSAGDYQVGQLGAAVQQSSLAQVLPRVYAEHAADRPGIVFTPTVAVATQVAASMNAAGISTAVVSGQTPRDERLKIYEDFRTGAVQVLANAQVLVEGYDAPWASCVVMARPTQSQPTYIQMVGRVLRPFPGKRGALVLDLVGASQDNRLRTLVDLDSTLFPQTQLCEACERTPCKCPCGRCGEPRPCACSAQGREERLRGTGQVVDLFAASSQSWLTTHRGVMFIPVGDGEVLLWPSKAESGTWDVVYAPKLGRWVRLHGALPMGSAMAWAESEAEERMEFNTGRAASWRKKRPSDKQLTAAQRVGVVVGENMRCGDVGDALSVVFASRKLDRYVRT